jgi:hypothetical protein
MVFILERSKKQEAKQKLLKILAKVPKLTDELPSSIRKNPLERAFWIQLGVQKKSLD